MNYAIVDIETTGGSAKKHGITEIAIIEHNGQKEIQRFETLINPNMLIPRSITQLTGISNDMVSSAPSFADIAEELWSRLEGRIFVAHNVNFDYGFIREQFHLAGYAFRSKKLCTVRLSRKIIPGLYSYSLGKIAQQLGYSIDHRHRAMGDCDFTAKLFALLLERDDQDIVKEFLNLRSRESTFPPHFNRADFDQMPDAMGVYIFKDNKGKVLYVGKANQLKKRVVEHFRGNTHTGYKSRFAEQITKLEWIECPNELIALLTEAREIKRYWPPFNNLLKRVTLNWGIYHYAGQHGYERLSIGRAGKWDKPIVAFRNQFEAKHFLEGVRQKYKLCHRYCGNSLMDGTCDEMDGHECSGACIHKESAKSYNLRVQAALAEVSNSGQSVIIQGEGFKADEKSVVLIENGRFKGHGLVSATLDVKDIHSVKDHIESGYDDQDMQTIIRSYIGGLKPEEKERILVYSG